MDNEIIEDENNASNNEVIDDNDANNETLKNEIIDNETGVENSVINNEVVGDNTVEETPDSGEDDEDDFETERILIVESSATANSIQNAIITRGDEIILGNQVIATGDIANMGGTKYTIVKKGDSTGDGYVKANDYLIIKDYIMETGTAKLEGAFKMAADVTGDNQVKANDYLKIKDHIMYGIEL